MKKSTILSLFDFLTAERSVNILIESLSIKKAEFASVHRADRKKVEF